MPEPATPQSLKISFEVPPGVPRPPAEIVASFCTTAASLVADGQALQALAFLGTDPGQPEYMAPIDTSDDATKEAAAAALRAEARRIEAQYAILIIESWYVEPRSRGEAAAICASERRIAEREDRRECVLVAVEVPGAQWVAMAPIFREPGRSWVETFEFRYTPESQGRMFGILPRAD